MKILVIGSGGREHAIAYNLSKDERVTKIYVAPGNGGTAIENKCENIDIKYNDIEALKQFAIDNEIYLTVVGPEEPLSKGIVDEFEKAGLVTFGPSKEAAQMEASKAYAKGVMINANIATADYAEFTNYDDSVAYIEEKGAPIVIKADGLAAGKGVTVAFTNEEAIDALKEIFLDNAFGESGNIVVIEEFMAGQEATYLAITDGTNIIPLDISQDHKQVFEGDKGPNTGGMGAYCPAPIVDKAKFDRVTNDIAYPMINEMKKRGVIYKGVIYAGLMINGDSIKVVEFNCRFGDPECQVVLSKVESGLLDALYASAKGDLSGVNLVTKDESAVCVVLTSGGYPKDYKSGHEITGLIEAGNADESVKVYHAGTKTDGDKVLTNGGRVLCVTAHDKDLKSAVEKAYNVCKLINFTDMHYRNDIAAKAFK